MIIISKHNDYYDYLANIYGRDEKKILRREKIIHARDIDFNRLVPLVDIFIAGRNYRLRHVGDGVWERYKFHKVNTDCIGYREHLLVSEVHKYIAHNYVDYIKTDFNEKIRQPLAIKYGYEIYDETSLGVPLLKSFGFSSFLNAEEIYSEIDMFLGWLIDNPPENTDFGDIIILESKGFDKKTSFRGKR